MRRRFRAHLRRLHPHVYVHVQGGDGDGVMASSLLHEQQQQQEDQQRQDEGGGGGGGGAEISKIGTVALTEEMRLRKEEIGRAHV